MARKVRKTVAAGSLCIHTARGFTKIASPKIEKEA
jgi:hypothetical protein